MHNTAVSIAVGLAVLAGAAPAAAQHVPAAGSWAVSGGIGAGVPRDPSLDKGLDVAGAFEVYFTPRISVRGQLGGSWFDVVGRGFTGTVTPVRLDGNVVYNWDLDVWHPYITAGIGLYRYRSAIAEIPTGVDTKAGVDVGGGVEYFIAPAASVTGEVLYHGVGAFAAPLTTFSDGSFWSFEVGLKVYGGR